MTPTVVNATEDSEDAPSQLVSVSTPRQSGSMVTHHDDVVTRMKNVEMIELGKHRIKPWYFAPYPQVRPENLTLLFLFTNNSLLFSFCSITGNVLRALHLYLRILSEIPKK